MAAAAFSGGKFGSRGTTREQKGDARRRSAALFSSHRGRRLQNPTDDAGMSSLTLFPALGNKTQQKKKKKERWK